MEKEALEAQEAHNALARATERLLKAQNEVRQLEQEHDAAIERVSKARMALWKSAVEREDA
jgi:predicted  nucleic acid-binding Zn-ribbon protein